MSASNLSFPWNIYEGPSRAWPGMNEVRLRSILSPPVRNVSFISSSEAYFAYMYSIASSTGSSILGTGLRQFDSSRRKGKPSISRITADSVLTLLSFPVFLFSPEISVSPSANYKFESN